MPGSEEGGTPPAGIATVRPAERTAMIDALQGALDAYAETGDHGAASASPTEREVGRWADARAQVIRDLLIKLGAPDEEYYPKAPDRIPDSLV